MRRTLTAAGSMLAVLTMAPLAMAQSRTEFGQQGEFIISADRLVPLLSFEDVSQDVLVPGGLPNNVKSETTTQTATSFSVLYGSPAAPVEQFYSVPRIGFDYVVVPNVTIGGNLIAVFSLGGSSKQETDLTNGQTNTSSTNSPTATGFGVAPRAGYILPINNLISLWLRGGFSYFIGSSKQPDGNNGTETTSINQFAIDLEPQVVFTPIPHVGFTAGLDVDIPLTGGHGIEDDNGGTSQSISGHSSVVYFGAVLGMLTHF